MRGLLFGIALAGLALLGLLAWIRLAPSDPARWHVDPWAAPDPGEAGVLLREDAVRPLPPEALLTAFERVAAAAPRSRRLAGSPAEKRVTWVVRSRLMGFPDYVTAAAVPAPGGARLAVLSRLRFGRGDLGVNRARLELWLRRLGAEVGGELE